jgi:hypothetical protein
LRYLWAVVVILCSVSLRANSYSTDFPKAENPISDGGHWLNGKLDGESWTNVQTTPHFAFGVTETKKYDDPTAILTGTWAPDQLAQGTVDVIADPRSCCHEVELRLRSTVTPNNITGYEIICSVASGAPYIQIVRWNGPLSSFDYIATDKAHYCRNGDMFEADMVGSTITVRLNHTIVLSGTDPTFASGNPGIGFYESTSPIDTYGFSQFMAIDSGDPRWSAVLPLNHPTK